MGPSVGYPWGRFIMFGCVPTSHRSNPATRPEHCVGDFSAASWSCTRATWSYAAEPRQETAVTAANDASGILSWLSKDPIGINGGLNQYVAFRDSPTRFLDPLGFNDWDVVESADRSWEARGANVQQIGKAVSDAAYNASAALVESGPVGDASLLITGKDSWGETSRLWAAAPFGAKWIGDLGRWLKGLSGGRCAIDDIIDAGRQLDKAPMTKAGRALEKHGSRPGGAFPRAVGNPAAKNAQGQEVLKELLTSNNQLIKPNRFGGRDIYDINTGRGVRFNAQAEMMGFLEP